MWLEESRGKVGTGLPPAAGSGEGTDPIQQQRKESPLYSPKMISLSSQ